MIEKIFGWIKEGIKETLNWFLENRELYKKRNNYFTKGGK